MFSCWTDKRGVYGSCSKLLLHMGGCDNKLLFVNAYCCGFALSIAIGASEINIGLLFHLGHFENCISLR